MPGMDIHNQIAGLVRVTEDITEAYAAVQGLRGLPEAFQHVNKGPPLIEGTLRKMKRPARQVASVQDAETLATSLTSCEDKADNLLEIFQEISSKSKDEYNPSVYRTIAIKLGKCRVETLMDAFLKDLEVLIGYHTFEAAMHDQVEPLAIARKELAKVMPSLPKADLEEQPGGEEPWANRDYIGLG